MHPSPPPVYPLYRSLPTPHTPGCSHAHRIVLCLSRGGGAGRLHMWSRRTRSRRWSEDRLPGTLSTFPGPRRRFTARYMLGRRRGARGRGAKGRRRRRTRAAPRRRVRRRHCVRRGRTACTGRTLCLGFGPHGRRGPRGAGICTRVDKRMLDAHMRSRDAAHALQQPRGAVGREDKDTNCAETAGTLGVRRDLLTRSCSPDRTHSSIPESRSTFAYRV
jgi:hypothetical protein